MKKKEYKLLLEAVERAVEICHESGGFMDSVHKKICDDLHDARRLLRALIGPKCPEES